MLKHHKGTLLTQKRVIHKLIYEDRKEYENLTSKGFPILPLIFVIV